MSIAPPSLSRFARLSLLSSLLLTGCIQDYWTTESIFLGGVALTRTQSPENQPHHIEIIDDKPYLVLHSESLTAGPKTLEVTIANFTYPLTAQVHLGGQRLSLPEQFFTILAEHPTADTFRIALSGTKSSFKIEGELKGRIYE